MLVYIKEKCISPTILHATCNNDSCTINNIRCLHNISSTNRSNSQENKKKIGLVNILKSTLLWFKEESGGIVNGTSKYSFPNYAENSTKKKKQFKRRKRKEKVQKQKSIDDTSVCVECVDNHEKNVDSEEKNFDNDEKNVGNNENYMCDITAISHGKNVKKENAEDSNRMRLLLNKVFSKKKTDMLILLKKGNREKCNLKSKEKDKQTVKNRVNVKQTKKEEIKETVKETIEEKEQQKEKEKTREKGEKKEITEIKKEEIEKAEGQQYNEKKENTEIKKNDEKRVKKAETENEAEKEKGKGKTQSTNKEERKNTTDSFLIKRNNDELFKMLKKEIVEIGKKRQEEKNVTKKEKPKEEMNIQEMNEMEYLRTEHHFTKKMDVEDTPLKMDTHNLLTNDAHLQKKEETQENDKKNTKLEENVQKNTRLHHINGRQNGDKSEFANYKMEELAENQTTEQERYGELLNKPGKRTIRADCLEDAFFYDSFYRKMFENVNDLKKYHFLRDRNSYLKLFETHFTKDAPHILKKVIINTNENEVKIFDESTYRTVFVVLKTLGIPLDELYYVLYNMKDHDIFKEQMDLIEDLLPKEKFIEDLKNLPKKKDWSEIEKNLRYTEKSLLRLCSISRIKQRVRILKFHYNIGNVKTKLQDIFELYKNGCCMLQNSTFLFQLFQAILTWMNFVNNGHDDTYKIKSINLFSLSVLKSFKTNGFQHNALQYIIANVLSFDGFTNVDEIIELHELLHNLQKLKGSEIIEEMNTIETEINFIKQELQNYRNEYKEVLIILIKIMDKGLVVFNKLNKHMEEAKDAIISLSTFFGVEDTIMNLNCLKFPSSESVFSALYNFVDDVFNILNEICINPCKMSQLLIDTSKKFGTFNSTQFYKNAVFSQRRKGSW